MTTSEMYRNIFHYELPEPVQTIYHQSLGFRLFSKLPVELRLRIWRATLPRNGCLWLGRVHRCKEYIIPPIPSSRANREARSEILKFYTVFEFGKSQVSYNKLGIIRLGKFLDLDDYELHKSMESLWRCSTMSKELSTLEIAADADFCDSLLFEIEMADFSCEWRFNSLRGLKEFRLIVRGKELFEYSVFDKGAKNFKELKDQLVEYFAVRKVKDPESPNPKIVIIDEEDRHTKGSVVVASYDCNP